jgi:hypothetical protein
MKKSLSLAAGALISLGLVLSGCAASTGGPTAGPTPAAGGTSVAPTSPPAAKAGKHIDVCAALPVAKVATLTGKPYVAATGVVDQKAAGLEGGACAYTGTQDSLTGFAIKVFYATPTAAWAFITSEDSSLGSPMTTKVSGIGDRAMTNGSDDLAVQYGSDVVFVEDTSEPPSTAFVPLSQLEQLASLVHSAMQ